MSSRLTKLIHMEWIAMKKFDDLELSIGVNNLQGTSIAFSFLISTNMNKILYL